ncbi:uncharacterized protein LOC117135087 [Drosophila busckii]|uniref:uncharacterized protein LOC117135087 n=1 Tax=Drosophila busckii TaxID=30019 RepID=UPI001432B5DF|nr:uncharacterized protein LOC117135087 [Drosophila busckii]
MPICKSTPSTATSKKSSTDISADHVTEAAQVKRTREQAYFNSYDFDAIEVLPYDDDEDDDEPAAVHAGGGGGGSRASSGRYSAHSGSNKYAYQLQQRLGNFFGHKYK